VERSMVLLVRYIPTCGGRWQKIAVGCGIGLWKIWAERY
jgi:hypothetical protein